MAEIHRGRLTIVGIGTIIDTKYKDARGRIQSATPLIADGAGGSAQPAMMFGVTETPYGWTYAAAALLASSTYDLEGSVIPADATVHLSRAAGGATYAQLVAGEIATVTPDATGAWSYEDLQGFNGTLYAWIRLDRTILDAYDCAVTCSMTAAARTPSGDGSVIYAAIPMDEKISDGQSSYSLTDISDAQGYPTLTVKGTCPAAVTQVYASKHPLVSCPDCTCQTCEGLGIVENGGTCTTCSGTGINDGASCTTCDGTGSVNIACPTCGATGIVGASPCATCGGSRTVQSLISEAILTDEVVGLATPSFTCAKCSGTGSVSSACATCGGTGTVNEESCSDCGGTGSVSASCTVCNGTGLLEDNTFSMTWDGEYHRIPADTTGIHDSTKWNYLIWCVAESGAVVLTSKSAIHRMCLAGDTPIRMADGSERRLDELSIGDLVLAGDGSATEVIRVQRGRWNPYHTLYKFEDGSIVDATAPHRFYNVEQGFYQWLDAWRLGEHARTADGGTTALIGIERVEEPAECFGLWTAARDYFAGGLLAGETAANQRLLAEATAEQAAAMAASLTEKDLAELAGWEAILP